jgi:hypothetical protein
MIQPARAASLLALITLLLTGCSMTFSAIRYSPMADTVAILRGYRQTQVNVGRFTMQEPRASTICRQAGPIRTQDVEPFEEFVRKAFVAELLMAEVYSSAAPVTLTGHLNHFDFSSFEGRWAISLVLTSTNGRQIIVEELYNYETYFAGEISCRKTAEALTPAVQDLVHNAVRHPDFAGL